MFVIIAVFLALDFCVLTGLVQSWGRWYSPFRPYRLQTEALFDGQASLSSLPSAIEHDLAWGPQGVQQIWGLGGPCWRLPFEALARAFGQPAFPDRLAFAAAVALATYLMIVGLSDPSAQSFQAWSAVLTARPLRAVAALLFIFFPPFVTLCSGPFNVYEEAVAYGYLYAVGLLAGSLIFVRRPGTMTYLMVSLAAGLAGFVRPTILAYGLATMLLVCLRAFRANWPWQRLMAGPTVFALGIALLAWSNESRFGAPFEFGHALTVSAVDLMYLTRFPAAFEVEPLSSAAAELFGSIFFVNMLNGFDVYERGVVAFQSATLRWRHFYQSTFDFTFLAGIVGSWILCTTTWRQRTSTDRGAPLRVLVLWSAAGGLAVFLFYMRFPCMSSRYVLDFAPAIAAAMGGLLLAAELYTSGRPLVQAAIVVVVGVWWGFEYATAQQSFPTTPVFSQEEALHATRASAAAPVPLPEGYRRDAITNDHLGIHGNCRGWRSGDGATESMVLLFVSDPTMLVVDVEAHPGQSLVEDDYRLIQPRLGREPLVIQKLVALRSGKRLIFAAPHWQARCRGIQILSIAFAPANDAATKTSRFVLRRVAWRAGHSQ